MIRNKRYSSLVLYTQLASFFMLILVSYLISFTFKDIKIKDKDLVIDIIWSIVSQIIFFGIFPFLIFKKAKSKEIKLNTYIRIKSPKINNFWKFSFIILIIPLSIIVSHVANVINAIFLNLIKYEPEVKTEINMSFHALIISIIISAILPAIFEEFLYRGLLFQSLRKEYGLGFSIFISALFFSLMHKNLSQMLFTFIFGIFFAIIYIVYKNILACILVHFFNNFFAVITEYLNSHGVRLYDYVFLDELKTFFGIYTLIKIAFIFIIFIVFYLKFKKNKYDDEYIPNDFSNLKEYNLKIKNGLINILLVIIIMVIFNMLAFMRNFKI